MVLNYLILQKLKPHFDTSENDNYDDVSVMLDEDADDMMHIYSFVSAQGGPKVPQGTSWKHRDSRRTLYIHCFSRPPGIAGNRAEPEPVRTGTRLNRNRSEREPA